MSDENKVIEDATEEVVKEVKDNETATSNEDVKVAAVVSKFEPGFFKKKKILKLMKKYSYKRPVGCIDAKTDLKEQFEHLAMERNLDNPEFVKDLFKAIKSSVYPEGVAAIYFGEKLSDLPGDEDNFDRPFFELKADYVKRSINYLSRANYRVGVDSKPDAGKMEDKVKATSPAIRLDNFKVALKLTHDNPIRESYVVKAFSMDLEKEVEAFANEIHSPAEWHNLLQAYEYFSPGPEVYESVKLHFTVAFEIWFELQLEALGEKYTDSAYHMLVNALKGKDIKKPFKVITDITMDKLYDLREAAKELRIEKVKLDPLSVRVKRSVENYFKTGEAIQFNILDPEGESSDIAKEVKIEKSNYVWRTCGDDLMAKHDSLVKHGPLELGEFIEYLKPGFEIPESFVNDYLAGKLKPSKNASGIEYDDTGFKEYVNILCGLYIIHEKFVGGRKVKDAVLVKEFKDKLNASIKITFEEAKEKKIWGMFWGEYDYFKVLEAANFELAYFTV